MSGELDPLAATGEPLGWAAGAGAVALWVTDGWAVAVAGMLAAALGGTLAAVVGGTLAAALGGTLAAVVGGTLAARLGEKLMLLLGARLAIAPPPLLLPHPVTEHAAPMIAAARSGPLTTKRRMPIPSVHQASRPSQDVA
jgi:hypothetical protein